VDIVEKLHRHGFRRLKSRFQAKPLLLSYCNYAPVDLGQSAHSGHNGANPEFFNNIGGERTLRHSTGKPPEVEARPAFRPYILLQKSSAIFSGRFCPRILKGLASNSNAD
jgi:hypothetical protein